MRYKRDKKTEQINIRVTKKMLESLEDCADKRDVTVSEYVRIKMESVLARDKRQHNS